jgi:hexosaminidase
LIDAARPESDVARHFADLVNLLIAGQATAENKDEIRSLLALWPANQAKLQSLDRQSFLLKEVLPVSEALNGLATVGIQAMDYLDRGERPPGEWRAQQLAFVQQASQPKAQVVIMIAPSIGKLVEASDSQVSATK